MEAEQDAKRSIELRVSNAVFSKLIKLGRTSGRTPQRVAQGLFEDAYVAECEGKSPARMVAAAGELADAVADDLGWQLAEAWAQMKRMEDVIASKDRMLLDQADEIRSMRAERDIAKQLVVSLGAGLSDALSEAPATLVVEMTPQTKDCVRALLSSDIDWLPRLSMRRPPATPAPVDAAGEPPKVTELKRLIRARRACGLSDRAIAREIGVPIEAVRQALK